MAHTGSASRLKAPFWVALLLVLVHGESPESAATEAEAAPVEENDPTKELLKQLTIGMMEVIDERTVALRPTSTKEGKRVIHLRLGNVGSVPRGSLSDADYAEKVSAAKAALTKLVDKQALWYKYAPENIQAPAPTDGSPQIAIADLWSRGGRHVSTAMKKEGHLSDVQEYESEIARDILGAAAKDEKDDSYKKLADALKENQEAQKAADKAEKVKAEEEQAAAEGLGIGGWIGIALLVGLGVGVATNFGQPPKKKGSLNRKKGAFEKLWVRLKGE